MLDRKKIIKIEVTSPAGRKLVVAEKDQFSFPRVFMDDMPVANIIIIKGKDLPEFEIDKNIYVITYMKNGDRLRYPAAVRMSLRDQLNVQLRSDYGTLMEERRRYFKVESDINCVITGFVAKDEEEFTEFENPVEGSIKNISIGGIFLFHSEQKFSPGDVLLISFRIENEFIDVMAKVLRVQRNHEREVEGYGCQFVNTDPNLEELFAQFVYNVQLRKRQEQMERDEQMKEGMLRIKQADE